MTNNKSRWSYQRLRQQCVGQDHVTAHGSCFLWRAPQQSGAAHVVLTKRADGVDYRFVDAAYDPNWYLQKAKQGTVAREYSD